LLLERLLLGNVAVRPEEADNLVPRINNGGNDEFGMDDQSVFPPVFHFAHPDFSSENLIPDFFPEDLSVFSAAEDIRIPSDKLFVPVPAGFFKGKIESTIREHAEKLLAS